jgi:hypothetical protein
VMIMRGRGRGRRGSSSRRELVVQLREPAEDGGEDVDEPQGRVLVEALRLCLRVLCLCLWLVFGRMGDGEVGEQAHIALY